MAFKRLHIMACDFDGCDAELQVYAVNEKAATEVINEAEHPAGWVGLHKYLHVGTATVADGHGHYCREHANAGWSGRPKAGTVLAAPGAMFPPSPELEALKRRQEEDSGIPKSPRPVIRLRLADEDEAAG